MKKDELKLVYFRNGNEEEAYIKDGERDFLSIMESVKKLFALGCRSVSLESQEVSLLFEASQFGGRSIAGRFKQNYRVVK